jgi:hypothetical protein
VSQAKNIYPAGSGLCTSANFAVGSSRAVEPPLASHRPAVIPTRAAGPRCSESPNSRQRQPAAPHLTTSPATPSGTHTPRCRCFGRRSSISGATTTPTSSGTTRSARPSLPQNPRDKPSDISSATKPSPPEHAPLPSCSSLRCTPTRGRHRSGIGVPWVEKEEAFSGISRCHEYVRSSQLDVASVWLTIGASSSCSV